MVTSFLAGSAWELYRRKSQPSSSKAPARAKARGIEVAQLVNELLKKDIELIEAAR